MFSNNKVITTLVSGVSKGARKAAAFISANRRTFAMMLCMLVVVTVSAQTNASMDTGTKAIGAISTSLVKYIKPVRVLCYALAGIIAIGGGISVYIKMNNEEQDVKNILVLQNWLERIRKEVTDKVLSIKRISEFLNFPILAQPTLKKI